MKSLSDLLTELFSTRQLKFFLHDGPDGRKTLNALPPQPESAERYAQAAIEELERSGNLDAAFFERLLNERPRRREDIEKCRAEWEKVRRDKKMAAERRAAKRAGEQSELDEALEAHQRWLESKENGERLVLTSLGLDPNGLDYRGAELRGADLSGRDLTEAGGLDGSSLARADCSDSSFAATIKGHWKSISDGQESGRALWSLLGSAGVFAAACVINLQLSDGHLIFGQSAPLTKKLPISLPPLHALWITAVVAGALFAFAQWLLSRDCRRLGRLPLLLPKERSSERARFWPLRLLMEHFEDWDPGEPRRLSADSLLRALVVVALWGIGPLTALLAWRRSLIVHHYLISFLLLALTVALSVYSLSNYSNCLKHLAPRLMPERFPAAPRTALILAVPLGAITSVPFLGAVDHGKLQPIECQERTAGIWVAKLAEGLGLRTWAVVEGWKPPKSQEVITEACSGWQEDAACGENPEQLRHWDLRYAHIKRSELGNRNLSDLDFTCSLIESTGFSKSDLSRADFNLAAIEGSRLCNACLEGADFAGTHLNSTRLIGARLWEASLSDCETIGADFQQADFDSASVDMSLLNALLEGADFRRLATDLSCEQKQLLCMQGALLGWEKTADCPQPELCRGG